MSLSLLSPRSGYAGTKACKRTAFRAVGWQDIK